MKESDYAFLLANIFLAQFVGKVWAMTAWVVHMLLFAGFLYLGE